MIDIKIGQIFGRLTVTDTTNYPEIKCVCECGAATSPSARNITKGFTQSCGCLHRDQLKNRVTTHGATSAADENGASLTYKRWRSMKARCNLPNSKSYENYGGRGIAVCESWNSSFEAFMRDMGECPSPNHTLDRKDFNGNYSIENCRWATRTEQNRNSSRNRLITLNGETKCASEWAEITGINFRTIMTRANKGLPAEQIFSKEKLPRKSKKPTECSTCFGQKIIWNDNYNRSLPCPECQPLDL